MEKRRLGQSELEVSLVGLGGMSLSADDKAASIRLVHGAHELGINYFDTADLYDRGANEELIGQAIAGFRHEIILATKVGNAWEEGKEGWTWNPTKAYIIRAIDDSLRRLQTDYLDLYQLHGGTCQDNFDEIIETFERLHEEGKIRAYGLSSIRPNVFQKYLAEGRPVSNMMQYSILDTRPEEYFCAFSKAEVSVVARGSLAQGLLIDKPAAENYLQHSRAAVIAIVAKVAELARQYGVTRETIALKYATAHPQVASAIVGIRTNEHLAALRQTWEEWGKVTAQDVAEALQSVPRINYQDHRD